MFGRKTLMMAVILALCAGVAVADVKMTQKQHTDGFSMMGRDQPPKDQTTVIWVGEDQMRTDTGTESLIVRMDEKKLYLVDHTDRTYSVVGLPVDVSKLLPEGMLDQMRQMMQLQAEVTRTDETAMVGTWPARKYEVELASAMMQTKQEVWATTEIDVDYEKFQAMMEQTLKLQPGSDTIVDELREIEGIQIKQRSVMTMMETDVVSTSEITEVETVDAPADHYAPPAGYSETQFDLMSELQKGAQ